MRKPKPINYETELKIRISQKLKKDMENIANAYGKTMSEYIRDLIEKDIYND